MKRTIMATVLILGGLLNAAQADTWVFRDIQRPNGHDRSMTAKRADGRKCGALTGGRSFVDADAPNLKECMLARGWTLDRIIPDRRSAHAHAYGTADHAPAPTDNSIDDDHRRQRDLDNTQQMLNQQNFFNQQATDNQQMQDQQQMQQQQQSEQITNEHYNVNQ